jgi:phosphoglycerate dehydrogenase-like enzyme
MNIILIQAKLSDKEIGDLFKEFPHHLYLSFPGTTYKELTPQEWGLVEIIFGNRLTKEELKMATQLRWIHTPTPHLNQICYDEILDKETILVTTTEDENIRQIGEYVMSGVFAFSKNLFEWFKIEQSSPFIWDSKLRDSMKEVNGQLFFQIGLNRVGSEIARQAKLNGMRVIGADEKEGFHPYCQRTLLFDGIEEILPLADVVCLTLPLSRNFEGWFTKEYFELMKEDAVLILIGASSIINEEDLLEVALQGKLRGVMIDAFYQIPIPPNSPLWKIPHVIITPEVSPRPKSEEKSSFQLFRFNLRQYLSGNFKEMKNVTDECCHLKSRG